MSFNKEDFEQEVEKGNPAGRAGGSSYHVSKEFREFIVKKVKDVGTVHVSRSKVEDAVDYSGSAMLKGFAVNLNNRFEDSAVKVGYAQNPEDSVEGEKAKNSRSGHFIVFKHVQD